MKNRVRFLLPLVFITTPVVGQVIYLSRFAVNVPFWDQWALPSLLRMSSSPKMGELWAALWSQHNEHRILFPRLIFRALAKISAWNVVAEMYASWFLAGLTLVGLGLIYRKSCCGSWWGFVPLAWLVFSLGQYENILWGWQLQIYLQVAATTFGIYFLSRRSFRSVVWAALCGTVASFSFNSGLLIWPVGLVCLAALRVEKKQLAFWSLAGTLVVVAYFIGYTPPHHPSPMLAFSQPLTTLVFFLANVGAPLGGGDLNWSSVMGAGLLLLLFVLLCQKLRAMKRVGMQVSESGIILGGLVLLSLLSSTVITVGRVGLGQLDLAISSRYTTITSVGIAGIYMLFIKRGLSNAAQYDRLGAALYPALLSLLIVGLVVTNLYGIRMGESLYVTRSGMKYALQTFEIQPDSVLKTLYPNPAALRERALFLKENRLSAFSEPVNMLLLTSSKKAIPVGEILPDRPVVQSFKCPVQTLNDVEINFATYARKNTSHVQVTLTDGDKSVVEQSLSSKEIKDNSWVHVVLPTPIQDCRGRELVLRITSEDASPGDAFTIWTHPRYYEGDLLEPGDESLAGRVIGLELNAYFYGLEQ